MGSVVTLIRKDLAVLAALCAAQFMLIVDVVVIYVALPSITRDLTMAGNHQHLVGVAYTLTFGSLLVVLGRAGDRLGRRGVLLAGVGLFTVASLAAALSGGTWHLLAARAAQGVGAAMVSSNALAAINERFQEGPIRNTALGLWAAVGSVGAIAGQLLGGLITDTLGWRWVFLVNVPVGVVVIAILAWRLESTTAHRRQRLDLLGSVLLVATLALVVGALAARSWSLLGIAAGSMALLVAAERRSAEPILPARLLRLAGVRIANLTLFLNAGGLGAAMFFVTLYLQRVLDYSPLAVSFVFAPVTVTVMLISPRAAALVGRYGVRTMLTTGLALLATGMYVLARVPVNGGLLDVLPGMMLLAIGSGISYAPTFVAAASGVRDGDHGAASGLITSMQELGIAACLALLALAAGIVAGDGSTATELTAGYRAGLIGAGALLTVATLWALTTPKALGRAAGPA